MYTKNLVWIGFKLENIAESYVPPERMTIKYLYYFKPKKSKWSNIITILIIRIHYNVKQWVYSVQLCDVNKIGASTKAVNNCCSKAIGIDIKLPKITFPKKTFL
jgi:hypothetical protein